jgi:Zn-dependent protease
VLALLVSVAFVILSKAGLTSIAQALIKYLLVLNIILMFFNLLPVPPLDGAAVLAGILPDSMKEVSTFLQRYGLIIFFALLVIPGVMDFLMKPARQLIGAWVGVLVGIVVP